MKALFFLISFSVSLLARFELDCEGATQTISLNNYHANEGLAKISPRGNLFGQLTSTELRLWKFEDYSEIVSFKIDQANRRPTNFSFSPDESHVVIDLKSDQGGAILLLDLTSRNVEYFRTIIVSWLGDQSTYAFSPSGKYLAFVPISSNANIQIYDIETKVLGESFEAAVSAITAIDFVDERFLFTKSTNGSLPVYYVDIIEKKRLKFFESEYYLRDSQISRYKSITANPEYVATHSTEDNIIVVWERMIDDVLAAWSWSKNIPMISGDNFILGGDNDGNIRIIANYEPYFIENMFGENSVLCAAGFSANDDIVMAAYNNGFYGVIKTDYSFEEICFLGNEEVEIIQLVPTLNDSFIALDINGELREIFYNLLIGLPQPA